jgi:mRNA interferase MazF
VWDVRFPAFGEHPALVLSVNPLNVRLGHVAVIPITGNPGPAATHVTLTADSGLTGHDESNADITGLQPLPAAVSGGGADCSSAASLLI